ncbi:hypothetical protein HanRHA438_Chr08g0348591 [Helianthus annuus]|nr:hypothetical protein HanRHA438_Chr08g0348591 [Helianthus annuus]
MALTFPSSSIFITYSHKSHHHLTAIKAQNSSSSSSPEQQPTESTTETSNSATTPVGFGSVSTSSPAKKPKGKRKDLELFDENRLKHLSLLLNRRNKGRRMSSRGATSVLFFLRG